ncbi:MAG: MarR family transcriptional regulator [Proteobacteria bacterium]|nr:MarR family transcriptional regulator [Pseudomonadota bacterium]
MKENQLDELSESALLLFPLLKHLFNGDSGDPALASLRNQTYHILRILERRGPLPVSAIGKQLFIAKQNMTTFVDRLINEGLVERKNDAADRRVINIIITEKGRVFVKERRQGLKKIVKENLSKLSDEDIESLHSVFDVIRTIVHKLE